MELEIKNILDRGNLEKERIIFTPTIDLPIGNYIALCTSKSPVGPTSVSGGVIKNSYWFPDADVKVKDLVVLYTKVGINNVKENADGTKTYFYYWYRATPLWGDDNSALVIANILDWSFKIASTEAKPPTEGTPAA